MAMANSAPSRSKARWLLPLAAGALACAPEIPAPKVQAAPASASTVDASAALTDDSQALMYVYSPVGKRDPFRDPGTIPKAGRGAVDASKLTPLQLYDIDQLRLVFTTTATSSPMALIVDPANRSHLVQIGDFVGKNWGKVSAIKRDELTITETMVDQNSQRVFPNYIPMRMAKTDAEKQAEQNVEWKVVSPDATETSTAGH